MMGIGSSPELVILWAPVLGVVSTIAIGACYDDNLLLVNIGVILPIILALFTASICVTFYYLQSVLQNAGPLFLKQKSLVTVLKKRFTNYGQLASDADTDVNQKTIGDSDSLPNNVKQFLLSARTFLMHYCKDYTLDSNLVVETTHELEHLTRKFLRVLSFIDYNDIVHGALLIILKHIKEYKRAVKKSTSNGGSVEEAYRYTHAASQNGQLFENFILKVTDEVLSNFLNAELYHSLSGHCLIGGIAKKVTMCQLIDSAKASFLNYHLINLMVSSQSRMALRLKQYTSVTINDVDLSEYKQVENIKPAGGTTHRAKLKDPDPNCEESHTPIVPETVSLMTLKESVYSNNCDGSLDVIDFVRAQIRELDQSIDISEDSPVNVDFYGVISEPVKIHKSQSTHKTWRNSADLDCISLGQEITEMCETTNVFQHQPDGHVHNFTQSKLWTDNAELRDLLKIDKIADRIEEEATLVTSTVKEIGSEISNVTAATFHNMKHEFQQNCTVSNVMKPVSQATSNAIHKIEDLQDDAAGMVEGLLGMGKAGFRRGLRLTGLQESELYGSGSDFVQSFTMRKTKRSGSQTSQADADKVAAESRINVKLENTGSTDSSGSVWINPLTSKSPSFDGEILLEMSPTDSVYPGSLCDQMPTLEVNLAIDSPDTVEYEDTPDLATTTAKLRSLLAQHTESAVSTPAALSPMPIEDKSSQLPTPLDPPLDSYDELTDIDSALLPRWAKAASGVFQNTINTIKTALPGNPTDAAPFNAPIGCTSGVKIAVEQGVTEVKNVWKFIANNDLRIFKRMVKLIGERKEFCTVDKAYEAVEANPDHLDYRGTTFFEFDEIDDFDRQVPIAKALVEIVCELISDIYPFATQESVVKLLLITTGMDIEAVVKQYLSYLPEYIKEHIGPITAADTVQNTQEVSLIIAVNDFVETLVADCLSDLVWIIFDANKAHKVVRLAVESLQSQRLNEDMALQIVELLAAKLIEAARKANASETS